MSHLNIKANVIDIRNRHIFTAEVIVENGYIQHIQEIGEACGQYILPGFIDAHVHIESSMLVPSEFAKIAVCHGTVATISDPHEIANVLGVPGVEYMIENGKTVPFYFFFGAPSCVPATSFETAGAVIDAEAVKKLLEKPEILYLSEMMNYPGVLFEDSEVMAKIAAAKALGKPVDGHAPGLTGEDALKYIAAGISTDHECYKLDEARFKVLHHMKIAIREGSAARNFNTLIPLLKEFPGQVMFCSDDKHPDDLVKGHINKLVIRALQAGYDLFDVLEAACITPVNHYNLPIGTLRIGDAADFILVDNIETFKHIGTWHKGIQTAINGKTYIETNPAESPNYCRSIQLEPDVLQVKAMSDKMWCIRALDGELITESFITSPLVKDGLVISDTKRDLLKLVVINRYKKSPPAVCFINGFGLKHGALASTVAHDSHNIIAVGTDDAAIIQAIHAVAEHGGGIAVAGNETLHTLPLPVAGLMGINDAWQTAKLYETADRAAKALGSPLRAPFMTLSFMALLVIPQMKLSDLGLFDGGKFEYKTLFE